MKILNLFTILFIGLGTCKKVLQLTKKNLPNVLRSHKTLYSLFHHSQCQNSRQYHQQFIQIQHSTSTVGIIDCSQQVDLCKQYNVKNYPTLMILKQFKNQQQKQSQIINQQLYLYENGLSIVNKTDKFKKSQILRLLKQQPNYIVVLFQQIGFPVLQKNKIYDQRIFYLSQGLLSQVLNGFVGFKPGCWIFQYSINNTNKNEKLNKYFCGDTYQQIQNLKNIIQNYKQGKMTKYIFDNSNYQDNRILGYKQLQYKFTNQHNFIKQCYLVYVWSQKCQLCDYKDDQKIIDRSLQIKNKKWKWYTYNLYQNQILSPIQLQFLPNIIKICPNHQQQLKISYLNQIITIKNLVKFLQSQQYQQNNIVDNDQL